MRTPQEQGPSRIVIDESACDASGVCLNSCPTDVFRLTERDGRTVVSAAYPEDCHECFLCQIDCPTGALQINFAPRTHGFVSIYDAMGIELPWPAPAESLPLRDDYDLSEVDGTDTDPPATV